MDPLLRSLAVKFMEINSLNQGGRQRGFHFSWKVTSHFRDVLCLCVSTSLPFI